MIFSITEVKHCHPKRLAVRYDGNQVITTAVNKWSNVRLTFGQTFVRYLVKRSLDIWSNVR